MRPDKTTRWDTVDAEIRVFLCRDLRAIDSLFYARVGQHIQLRMLNLLPEIPSLVGHNTYSFACFTYCRD